MSTSLKTRYSTKIIAERLILATTHANLLIEAMSESDLTTADQILSKLRQIKGKGLKNLDAAIGQAEAEINKYTGGGPVAAAWSKLKTTLGFNNPLVKVMTFANALENGFKMMGTIVKNNLGTDVDKTKSITDLGLNSEQQKTLLNNMRKALSPQGLFGALKRVPYVEKDKLISDLLTTPLDKLATIVKVIESGPQTQQVAQNMRDTLKASQNQSSGSEPGAPSTNTEKATSSQSTKGTVAGEVPKPAEQQPNVDQQAIMTLAKKHVKPLLKIVSQHPDEPGKTIFNFLRYLSDKNLLKLT